jgi:hypothetical protein
MKKYLLIGSIAFLTYSAQAQIGFTDSLQQGQPANPASADPFAGQYPTQDNFLDQSQSIPGAANAPGNGNGNGRGNGNGIGNGNGNPLDPIDPGPDPGIPVDGGLLMLLAAGAIFGSFKLYQLSKAN